MLGNYTRGDGGAVWTATAVTAILDSLISNNRNGQNSAGTAITDPTADGGAVYVSGGGHTIGASGFVNNDSANDGGAIYSGGTGNFGAPNPQGLVANTFALNTAGAATTADQASRGGAVALDGESPQNSILNTYLANEVAAGPDDTDSASLGGAVSSYDTFTSQRDTFADNTVGATGRGLAAGGAVHVGSYGVITALNGTGDLEVGNSTFNGNSSTGPAAVAWTSDGGSTIDMTHATIAANGSPLEGGSMLQTADGETGTLTLENSILSQGLGVSSACVAQTLDNDGGNVLTTSTDCGGNAFVTTPGGSKVTDAQLALQPLANNGADIAGLTVQTMALGLGSVAKSSAPDCDYTILENTDEVLVDERGLPRPATNCSSGAYQLTTEEITLTKIGPGQGTVTSNPAGLDCAPDCAAETAEFALNPAPTEAGLQPIILTATATSGSAFVAWGVDCASSGTSTTCTLVPDGAKNVTAEFRDTRSQLTAVVTGNGEGRITSSPAGIDCRLGGGTCQASYDPGTVVTLTAAAEGRSEFRGWSGACASAGTAPTCQVTMDAARTVSAEFNQRGEVNINRVKKGLIKVPRNRVVSVARVQCLNGNCAITQATVKVRVRGKTYNAKVRGASGSFAAGSTRTVKAVVPKRAYRGLTNRKSGRMTTVIRAEGTAGSVTTTKSKNFGNGLRR